MIRRRLFGLSLAGLTGLVLLLGLVVLAARPAAVSAAGAENFSGAVTAFRPKTVLAVEEGEGGQFCSMPWLNIPDNNPAGVTDLINLGNLGTITDLNVYLQIDHTYVGDLRVTLEHVDTGTTATLVNRPGVPATTWGCGGNNIDVTVDDQGMSTPIENQCQSWPPAIHGQAKGGDPPGLVLSVFNGEAAAGDWELTVADLSPNDVGELMEWCLDVTAVLEPDIAVDPAALNSTQEVDTQVTQVLTISNLGNADLTWTITEEGGGIPTLPLLDGPAGEYVAGNTPDAAGPAPEDGVPTQDAPEWNPPNPLSGPAYGWNWNHGQYYTAFDLATPNILPNTKPFPAPGDFIGAGELVDGRIWMIDWHETLYELEPATGQVLSTKAVTALPAGQNYSGMALDPTTGIVYLTSTSVGTSYLYTLNLATGVATLINSIHLGPGIIAIAIDDTGTLYGADIIKDALLEINKSTGGTILVGHFGFNANYGQGMAWDPATDTLFMAAYNGSRFQGELRTVDRTTGVATYIQDLGTTFPGGQNQLGWVSVDVALETCDPSDISWLALDPTSGTTLPGTSSLVEVTYDSTGLLPDVYTGTLCIESNDPDTRLLRVPVTLTVTEVVTPTPDIALVKTVGLDPAVCGTSDTLTVDQGDTVIYCYTVENTGDITLALHDLDDSDLGNIFTGLPYTLTPGASVAITQAFVPQTTTTNLATWTACNLDSGAGGGGCSNPDAFDVVTATDSATVTVIPPEPAISLAKTVGTDPTQCATGSTVQVLANSFVYYCYTVTNTGEVTLNVHDLDDSSLGQLLDGFPFTLAPGASVFVTATEAIEEDTVNSATWTACNQPNAGAGCDDPGATQVVSASDQATVIVIEPDIEMQKTAGTNPAECAIDEQISVIPGTDVTYCYEVFNTGEVTLTLHELDDSELGMILTGFPFNLAPGASLFVTTTAEITTDTVNIATWTACVVIQGQTCDFQSIAVVTATDSATVTMQLPVPGIAMTKTVGTNPAVCATGEILTVPQGSEVTFCYAVSNTGDIPLGVHDLDDTDLGPIFEGLVFNLNPGDSTFVTYTTRVFTDMVNAAIWTACNNANPANGCGAGATDVTTAIDAATVIVTEGIPDIDLAPLAFTVTVPAGDFTVEDLTVSNVGLGILEWLIYEEAPPTADSDPPGALPPYVAGNAPDSAGPAPTDGEPTARTSPPGPNPLALLGEGTTAYGWNWNHGQYYTVWDLSLPGVLPNTKPFPAPGDFIGAGEYVDGRVYMIDFYKNLYELDPDTGMVLATTMLPHPGPGQNYSGLALDPTTGVLYLSSTSVSKSRLYTLDLTTGLPTFIGEIDNAPAIISIAVDGSGTLYGADIVKNSLFTINKTTATATLVGHLGFDANFGQGMAWDPSTDTLFMAAYNGATYRGELRTVNRTTGYATFVALLGSTYPGGQNQLGWVAVDLGQGCVPGEIPWLLVNPSAGSTLAGDGTPVEVTFNAAGLDPGTYTGAICVSSNDPDEPLLRVPLTMNVTSTGEGFSNEIFLPKVWDGGADGDPVNPGTTPQARAPEMLLVRSTPLAFLVMLFLGRSYRRREE